MFTTTKAEQGTTQSDPRGTEAVCAFAPANETLAKATAGPIDPEAVANSGPPKEEVKSLRKSGEVSSKPNLGTDVKQVWTGGFALAFGICDLGKYELHGWIAACEGRWFWHFSQSAPLQCHSSACMLIILRTCDCLQEIEQFARTQVDLERRNYSVLRSRLLQRCRR